MSAETTLRAFQTFSVKQYWPFLAFLSLSVFFMVAFLPHTPKCTCASSNTAAANISGAGDTFESSKGKEDTTTKSSENVAAEDTILTKNTKNEHANSPSHARLEDKSSNNTTSEDITSLDNTKSNKTEKEETKSFTNFTEEETLKQIIKVFNHLGRSDLQNESSLLHTEELDSINPTILQELAEKLNQQSTRENKNHVHISDTRSSRINLTLAILVCGERRVQALVMLKSAVMFSLDANLHVIVVSDAATIKSVGIEILMMRMVLQEIGYKGYTFELVLEWYPKGKKEPDWKSMYQTCSNQRLFFPSLLKHHDALIYLDIDVIVLANLTEMWQLFKTKMIDQQILAVTPNSEAPGYYNLLSQIPYYGTRGINAGVMLMNLTRMRAFNFESRAKAIYTAYDQKIVLADQDIINGIFHPFQDLLVDITCSYNFYWLHCNYPSYDCYPKKTESTSTTSPVPDVTNTVTKMINYNQREDTNLGQIEAQTKNTNSYQSQDPNYNDTKDKIQNQTLEKNNHTEEIINTQSEDKTNNQTEVMKNNETKISSNEQAKMKTNIVENICFCNRVIQDGVRILHGNMGTFTYRDKMTPFLYDAYTAFRDLDLYTDSYSGLFRNLTDKFNKQDPRPCSPMTADMLYKGALDYLQRLGL
ncbi:unnamed protein product [Allacma fusca]|uniref:Uncharacterized protein n=1 Tax=Allacma fusca TaxID=39272 RepID=A0A8J2PYM7_9HEXA|nr:unnamed protein product [Allacma fusca]